MTWVPERFAAWVVHAYTASGAALALIAGVGILAGDYRRAFLALYAALVIDATDGWLARRARASDVLPGIDGRRLDDIVDYLTFVFVPAILLVASGRLPAGWGAGVACVLLAASALGFARADAKSVDHFFTGFPSYWNIVAFYLYIFDWSPVVNAATVLALCGLVFVPIGFAYPSRTPVLRRLTIWLGVVWAVLVLAMVLHLPAVPRTLVLVSLIYPGYYTVLSLWLHGRRGA